MRLWSLCLAGWVSFHIIMTLILPDPVMTDPAKQLMPPSAGHWLGTDYLGRDIASRSIHGGVFSLFLTSISTLTTVLLALFISVLSLFWNVINIFKNVFIKMSMAFPPIILVLILLAFAPGHWVTLIIALILVQLAPTILVVYASMRAFYYTEYSLASIAMGASRIHITKEHLLRNISPLVMSYIPLLFSHIIFYTSAIAFLGLSPDSSQPDWGMMIMEGRATFRYAPLNALAPGFSVVFTIFVLNRLSESITHRRHF